MVAVNNNYFSSRGRVGRRTLFWASIASTCLMFLSAIFFFVILFSTTHDPSISTKLFAFIQFLIAIPISLWIFLAALIKRLRDLQLSPWLSLTVFMPFVGNFALILFLIAPGKYGEVKMAQKIDSSPHAEQLIQPEVKSQFTASPEVYRPEQNK